MHYHQNTIILIFSSIYYLTLTRGNPDMSIYIWYSLYFQLSETGTERHWFRTFFNRALTKCSKKSALGNETQKSNHYWQRINVKVECSNTRSRTHIFDPLNFVFWGLLSPPSVNNETDEAIKEAKFIRNNIINVTVLTAKFKSLKELHMFLMRELNHPIMTTIRSEKWQLVI